MSAWMPSTMAVQSVFRRSSTRLIRRAISSRRDANASVSGGFSGNAGSAPRGAGDSGVSRDAVSWSPPSTRWRKAPRAFESAAERRSWRFPAADSVTASIRLSACSIHVATESSATAVRAAWSRALRSLSAAAAAMIVSKSPLGRCRVALVSLRIAASRSSRAARVAGRPLAGARLPACVVGSGAECAPPPAAPFSPSDASRVAGSRSSSPVGTSRLMPRSREAKFPFGPGAVRARPWRTFANH